MSPPEPHIRVPARVARMFVDAWAWSTATTAHPDQLGPTSEHNRQMLDVCRNELAVLDEMDMGRHVL